MKIRISFVLLALGLLFANCTDNKSNGAKTQGKEVATANKPKKTADKAKPAKKQTKGDWRGMKMSKRTARARFVRVQGQAVKEAQSMNVKVTDGKLRILGWAFDDVTNKPAKSVFIDLNGQKFRMVYGQDSKQLAKRMKNNSLAKVGFRGGIDINKIKGKKLVAKILVVGSDGKGYYVSDPLTIKL